MPRDPAGSSAPSGVPYVFRRLFLEFRHPEPPDSTAGEAEEHASDVERYREELDEEAAPAPVEREAVALALGWYAAWKRFGPPRPGGADGQPVRWRMAVDFVEGVRSEALAEHRREEAGLRRR